MFVRLGPFHFRYGANEIARKRSREREREREDTLRLRLARIFPRVDRHLPGDNDPKSSKRQTKPIRFDISIGARRLLSLVLITGESWIRRKLNFRFLIDSYTSNYFFHPPLVPSAIHPGVCPSSQTVVNLDSPKRSGVSLLSDVRLGRASSSSLSQSPFHFLFANDTPLSRGRPSAADAVGREQQALLSTVLCAYVSSFPPSVFLQGVEKGRRTKSGVISARLVSLLLAFRTAEG